MFLLCLATSLDFDYFIELLRNVTTSAICRRTWDTVERTNVYLERRQDDDLFLLLLETGSDDLRQKLWVNYSRPPISQSLITCVVGGQVWRGCSNRCVKVIAGGVPHLAAFRLAGSLGFSTRGSQAVLISIQYMVIDGEIQGKG